MATTATATTTASATTASAVELYDWMLNEKCVRGSMKNDNGVWLYQSAKPKSFDAPTRTLTLSDGTRYIIKRETMCKALNLNKTSEHTLTVL